jgi:hypothetical protein
VNGAITEFDQDNKPDYLGLQPSDDLAMIRIIKKDTQIEKA